ncbi:MAG: DUF2486 family protein [Burkholderia sp.]
MPDAHNEFDIPVLTDVLVPGKSALARRSWQSTDAAPPHATDLPELSPEVPPELAGSGLSTLGEGASLSTAYGAPAGADALPVSHLAAGEPERSVPQGLVSSPAARQDAETPAFVAPEPVAVPPEFAAEPQPLPATHEAPAVGEPEPAEAVEEAAEEAAFVAPEAATPREFSAIPAPLVEPQAAPLESTPAEATFVPVEPAVPQEFAAAPQPLPVEGAPAEAEARPDPRDDEHGALGDAALAYALDAPSQESAAASATPQVDALHPAHAHPDDLAARTESALHRIETLAPAAFAQLSPVDADTPVPARFADVEALPPAARIDSRRIAERLQGRVADYLSGEGRALIDARCREAVQQHAAWLVGAVSQQVVTALAPEFERWVAEAVDEALAHRDAPPSRGVVA